MMLVRIVGTALVSPSLAAIRLPSCASLGRWIVPYCTLRSHQKQQHKGPMCCESRQFVCTRICFSPLVTSPCYFSHPSSRLNAVYAPRLLVPRVRGGRLRVWIKNSRHASPQPHQ